MTTQIDDKDANKIAAFLQQCSDQLQQQADRCRGWPDPLRLPMPRSNAERQALNLWLDEVQRQTGAPIRIDFPPPRAS